MSPAQGNSTLSPNSPSTHDIKVNVDAKITATFSAVVDRDPDWRPPAQARSFRHHFGRRLIGF